MFFKFKTQITLCQNGIFTLCHRTAIQIRIEIVIVLVVRRFIAVGFLVFCSQLEHLTDCFAETQHIIVNYACETCEKWKFWLRKIITLCARWTEIFFFYWFVVNGSLSSQPRAICDGLRKSYFVAIEPPCLALCFCPSLHRNNFFEPPLSPLLFRYFSPPPCLQSASFLKFSSPSLCVRRCWTTRGTTRFHLTLTVSQSVEWSQRSEIPCLRSSAGSSSPNVGSSSAEADPS